MSEVENPVSEGEQQPEETVQEQAAPEQQEERTVPLTALEAERKKRQEAETQARLYELYLQQQQQQPQQQEEDGDDILTKNEYRQNISLAKREILEEAFHSSNPQAVKQIEEYLPELIKQKPWIRDAVENAPNRWQRAWEMVSDFYPKPDSTSQKSNDAQRIVENAQKPGSPTVAGKSAAASKVEYMRSIRGTQEWDEYRSKLRQGLA